MMNKIIAVFQNSGNPVLFVFSVYCGGNTLPNGAVAA